MKKNLVLVLLLLSALLSACAKLPSGKYVSGGMKKLVVDKANGATERKITEVRPWQEKETLVFDTNGTLQWTKTDAQGNNSSSDGKWKMMRDHAGVTNVHASFETQGHRITYILGQRKNDAGEDELHLKAYQKDDEREKSVSTNKELVMSAFTKVKD
tara:strand:- start:193 stop:663 length:471 start_codon:yes stop_codon:yes gene_type:complete